MLYANEIMFIHVCMYMYNVILDTFLSILAQTKFVECENCRHFFLILNESGLNHEKQEHSSHHGNMPSPKKVYHNIAIELLHVHVPYQIWAHLNKHVIGQEIAKKQLAVAVYNHYKRINNLTGGAKPKPRPQFGGTLLMSDEKTDDRSNISNGS